MKVLILLVAILLASVNSCTKSEKEQLYEKLNYENRKFGFSIRFPESWINYRVIEKQYIIDENLDIYGLYFILPTRSSDWQPINSPENSATIFKLLIFSIEEWDFYNKEYVGADKNLELKGRLVGKTKKFVFFVEYSKSVPVDLYLFMRETESVISTFRLEEE